MRMVLVWMGVCGWLVRKVRREETSCLSTLALFQLPPSTGANQDRQETTIAGTHSATALQVPS